MAEINLHFHMTKALIEEMPADLYEVIERIQDGEEVRLYKLRPLLSYFLADESNKPLSAKESSKLLGSIPASKYGEVARQFTDALKETAVPNANGDSSGGAS